MLRDNLEKQALYPKFSSFNSVENTLSEVVKLLLRNERLKRLLYYTDPHALSLPQLTPTQSLGLMGNQIKIVPKLEVEPEAKPYVILTMDNFIPSENITTFREVTLGVDIICPYDYWNLPDFKLRPYAIAGEIDAMLNKSNITGLGIATFAGAKMLLISPEAGGLSMYYNLETKKDDLSINE